MTLTEQFANNEVTKQKAAAFDRMQREAELANEYNRGNGDAYAIGRRDGAAELNALMQEGLARQIADPKMYDAPEVPVGMTQGQPAIQGSPIAQPTPDLRTSNETVTPAPSGLASALGGN